VVPGWAEAVVFDCDGLLVDTESGWSRAEAAIFAEHGFGFGPEQKGAADREDARGWRGGDGRLFRAAAEDAERPKPAPDFYLAACARLGVPAQRCVAFEDSRTGVASARAAGLFVVGVPSPAGVTLAVDAEFGSLADPLLVGWAVVYWSCKELRYLISPGFQGCMSIPVGPVGGVECWSEGEPRTSDCRRWSGHGCPG
jgi:beta-phosphoglucomutase-like phosphatase (HAD superfamily)